MTHYKQKHSGQKTKNPTSQLISWSADTILYLASENKILKNVMGKNMSVSECQCVYVAVGVYVYVGV